MGWIAGVLPVLWAQASGAVAPATSTTANPNALASLALRRWCGSLTLSSPESVPSLSGLWVWVSALGGLFGLALVFQGPGRALGQFLDLPGHAGVVSASNRRLRRSGRVLAVTVGLTVLSWTGSQSFSYSKPQGREDVTRLTRARNLVELAVEQGVLAGLTPLRDVAGLGANLPLLLVATLLVFRASADRRGGSAPPPWLSDQSPRVSGWANTAWVCGASLVAYRLVALGTDSTELPPGGYLMIEALLVPALMAVCDGLLLGWVLAELRGAGSDGPQPDGVNVHGAVELMPASVVACLAALPARYLAAAVWLAWNNFPSTTDATAVGSYIRWQLGHGLADVQGVGLLVAGAAGAVAWGSGGVGEAVRGYARLLSAQGARVVVVFALSGLAAGAASAVAYVLLLSLPAAPWVLNAADSYAHYGTLPVGLWALCALVELGERSLPEANLSDDGPGRVA